MFITASAAFLFAVVFLYLTPRVLADMRWQVRHPRLALLAWFGALFVGCGCILLSLMCLVFASLGVSPEVSITGGLALTFAGWLSLVVLGCILACILAAAEPLLKSHRAALSHVAPGPLVQEKRAGFTLTRFHATQPRAYTVGGKHPEILLSSGLESLLPVPQVQAVLAHEYAHLRQRHGLAIRIAEINALCLPAWSRVGHDLKRATLLLVELAADDAAARQAGAVHLARALYAVAEDTGQAALKMRVLRLMQRSWPLARTCTVPKAIRV